MHPSDASRLTPDSRIDLWREPDSKDDPGWRGPATMIKSYPESNKFIVTWRGYPMLVPLRHVRPHMGFVWFFMNIASMIYSAIADVVSRVMLFVE